MKKEFIWIALLIALAFLYVHFFTNWFVKPQMVITPSRRPNMAADATVDSVVFTLNGEYKIKNIQVLELGEDGKFNPKGHQMWHLTSNSNSAPTQILVYGHHVKGMKQAADNNAPEPLQPDVGYRILITANNVSGFADFKTRAEQ